MDGCLALAYFFSPILWYATLYYYKECTYGIVVVTVVVFGIVLIVIISVILLYHGGFYCLTYNAVYCFLFVNCAEWRQELFGRPDKTILYKIMLNKT